jgi:hypothetical protein
MKELYFPIERSLFPLTTKNRTEGSKGFSKFIGSASMKDSQRYVKIIEENHQ